MQMAAAAQDAGYGFVFLCKFSNMSISSELLESIRYAAQTYACKQSRISSSCLLEVIRWIVSIQRILKNEVVMNFVLS